MRIGFVRAVILPAAILCVASAPRQAPPAVWAVLVGINDYIEYVDEPGGDLRGAERDARSIRQVLVERWKVPPENIHMLLNRDATREAIRKSFQEWLGQRVKPGDLAIFYFSGHGSKIMDKDGDEADGVDETICPADVSKVHTGNDIRDDELRGWIGELPSKDVVVILDSCHSGTATRVAGYTRARSLAGRPALATTAILTPDQPSVGESITDTTGLVIEIAGAAANQTAMDASFQSPGEQYYGGAFTTHLVRQLWRLPLNSTYRQAFRGAVIALKADGFAQDPQLSGALTRSLFSTAPVEPVLNVATPAPGVTAVRPPITAAATQSAQAINQAPPRPAPTPEDIAVILVRSVERGGAVISAGATRGMTEGSVLETAGGALLRVRQVRADDASAAVVRGTPNIGDTLALVGVALPEPRLRVRFDTGLPAVVATALADSARSLGDVGVVADSSGVTDLYFRAEPQGREIHVLMRDGSTRTRIAAAPLPAAVGLAAKVLRRELAIKRLAALENPVAPFAVELQLAGGKRDFQIGEEITFSVRSERAGYLTLIDLGTDGTVTLLYPNSLFDMGKLQPNQEVQIPGAFLQAQFTISPPEGLGLVRAIVSETPLDLPRDPQGLVQAADGDRLADQIRTSLQQQVGMRNITVGRREQAAPQWATTLAVYQVKR